MAQTCFKKRRDQSEGMSGRGRPKKSGGVIESDIRRVGVSEKNSRDRVKFKYI